MRVISQNGKIDYPYEQSIVFIDPKGTHAVLIQPAGEHKGFALGIYSTKEKAIKAMEMLREAWIKETVEFEDGIYHRNIIFQFPQDSEIEV